MTAHRRLAASASALLALALALAGCTSSGDDDEAASSSSAPASSAAPEAEPIEWDDCSTDIDPIIAGRPGSDRDLSFECGTTSVPVSYDDPDGGTLQLFLVKATLAGQANRIGSLVVNPGGPGQSATDAAIQSALTLPPDVLGRFDIVGVDPRGVGLSTPVECISDEQKDELFAADPRATDAAALEASFGRVDEVAEACAEKYKAALGAFDTVDSARDMDLVRQALGDEQLTYLGYSYGTTLGSTYAELFPENVRALVLDGAVDPDAGQQESAEAQAQGFEAAFENFAQNCTGLISGCPLGPDPRSYVNDVLAQSAATPIPSSRQGETRQATPGLVLNAVRSALYQPTAWPQLAQSLTNARNGDAAGILTLADTYTGRNDDGTYSNVVDANVAVNCADTDEEFTRAQVSGLIADWNAKYPLFGADAALGLYTCSAWDAPRTPLPERDAEGSAPILVIGTQGDPVTPLPGAVDMAEDLVSGVLLTWQGYGHTAYPKTDCVTAAVNAYLIDLTAPQDGLTCPA
ncbi:alpha/beta hydrolase [Modestobacter versicolor]|uniref:Alpha/beta hydrolase n=1 Tax=Modestobacter versicolor TaxID=429133 RepID=A0A323VWL6_9ACTN|nr:alpha/beta hydrolase [Modestobacter versicolor]MBB3674554.1 pimeloyl-ACP methyl ester carboxylesterase [Modestobacter versicolor]PZA23168.1 alpha/beta hydrolase [Modestobacter versicolor]